MKSSNTVSAVALAAATPKTVMSLITDGTQHLKMSEFGISFDGVTGSAVPVLVEIVRIADDGTFTTGTTIVRDTSDSTTTSVLVAGRNYSVEPTEQEIVQQLYVPAYGGLFTWYAGAGDEIWSLTSGGIGIRCAAPANVNCSGYIVAVD